MMLLSFLLCLFPCFCTEPIRSPPFQIGRPLEELTQKDFETIFSKEELLAIAPVGGGLSGAKIYKVKTQEKEYLVRYSSGIFGPKEIFQEFAIQKQMGCEGISPKVYYSDPERGIVTMDFIHNKLKYGRDPNILNSIPKSSQSLMKLLRKVHESKITDCVVGERIPLDYVKRAYQEIPEGFLDQKDAALLKRIVDTPWPVGKQVLTHGDFRSDNLLYDDANRFWIIDWELAGLGHPFYDIAYFANYQALSPEEGEKLLSIYLDRAPNCEDLKDFRHLRRIAFGFTSTLALPGLAQMGDQVKQAREGEVSFNTLTELWQRIDEGTLDFAVPRDEYRISLFILQASADY